MQWVILALWVLTAIQMALDWVLEPFGVELGPQPGHRPFSNASYKSWAYPGRLEILRLVHVAYLP